jgi:hypothetical protein
MPGLLSCVSGFFQDKKTKCVCVQTARGESAGSGCACLHRLPTCRKHPGQHRKLIQHAKKIIQHARIIVMRVRILHELPYRVYPLQITPKSSTCNQVSLCASGTGRIGRFIFRKNRPVVVVHVFFGCACLYRLPTCRKQPSQYRKIFYLFF